jgi:DNA mismatch repair protein MSH6
LHGYLEQLQQNRKGRPLVYVNSKYQYEVECEECDEATFKKERGFDVTSTKKGYIRFHTAAIKGPVEQLEDIEQRAKDAVFPFMSALFKEFHSSYTLCSQAMELVAELDALLSLATASGNGLLCRPTFVESETPVLDLRGCRHPVAASTLGDSFVPNDTQLNTQEVPASALLVTGPNMGGKSTVLRQTCLAVVMAQVGCYVAADKAVITPVDRIFTRIGANDCLIEGKSTFLVELEETSALLTKATSRSLAVLDELGRGTSTFDGTAIALAVLSTSRCRLKRAACSPRITTS